MAIIKPVKLESGKFKQFSASDKIPIANIDLTKGLNYYKQVGTTRFTRWYFGGVQDSTALTTGVPLANLMYAFPFFNLNTRTVNNVAFSITTGGTSSACRCGIYNNTSDIDLYPSTLVVDGGSFATTTTGVKSTVVSVNLTANTLYWFVILASGAPVATMRCMPIEGAYPIFGTDSTLATASGVGVSVAQTYGAFPSTFTAGGAVITAIPLPIMAVSFSA